MSITFSSTTTANTAAAGIFAPTAPAAAELPAFARQRVERFYSERVQASWNGRHILRGLKPERTSLMLQSNDYLAITQHPLIVEAQRSALADSGNGMMMSSIFMQHDDDPVHVLERELAMSLHTEDAILTQSGYVANVGLVQSLAGERTPVYVDMLAHTSLWEGIKSAGANAVPILHNDADYLERQILRHGPGVVLVDSVYSTNGSLCPLETFANIAQRHGCVFVVDESHSLGTHGRAGEGLVASQNLNDRVHFITASLAKAYCARAGLIACSRHFKQYFAFESLPAIFSSSLLPHELAGIDAAHRVIGSEGWRRARLGHVTRRVREGLTQLGYPIGEGSEQIIALEPGAESATMLLRDRFEEAGIFGSIFCAPATAKNRSLLRLTLNASMDDTDIEFLLGVAAKLRSELRLEEWSASRRARRGLTNLQPALAEVA
ncbi:MAG: alpha-hydroxyketone-type quorum-sensing autoinducer synthase [Tahibacter sp.]